MMFKYAQYFQILDFKCLRTDFSGYITVYST